MSKVDLQIALNGTDTNPWHKMGLTQNPFPQLGKAELDQQVMRIQALGGDPIPDADYIRSFLKGYVSDELIELCASMFKKGEMVRFTIFWNVSDE